MPLPNPGMTFTPFDPLTAAEMNDLVENIEALQNWSAYDNGTLPQRLIEGNSDGSFDYVASGAVLAGTGYGSTQGWSLSAGVVYINGKKYTIAATTGNATASRDTYFDALEPASGTVATLVNTSGNIVTNNAASPALAANSVRLGIIVSGASNIASVASVNQGQENKLVPIASSVPYAVTDSLGNLINPRDKNRKLLGQRQITSNATATTLAQITGLIMPIIVPTGRKVRYSLVSSGVLNSQAAGYVGVSLYTGSLGGTQVGGITSFMPTASTPGTGTVLTQPQSTTGSITVYAGLSNAGGGGTATISGSASLPIAIIAELY